MKSPEFDFSKPSDQKRFASLPADEQGKRIDSAHQEASKIDVKKDQETIQHFKDRLAEIKGKRPTVSISNFLDEILHDLVALSNEIIQKYTLQNNPGNITKELEDKAYAKYGLSNLSEILTDIQNKRNILNAANAYIQHRVVHSQDIITPPEATQVPVPISSKGIRSPEIENRLQTLLYILKEKGISWDKIHTTDGTISDTMMRQLSYYSTIIPEINRLVLVCNEEANASYVFDLKKLEALGIPIKRINDMTKEEKNDFLAKNPTAGVRFIESERWIERTKEFLFEDINKNINIPQVEQNGLWKGFYYDPVTNMYYGNIDSVAEHQYVDLSIGTLIRAINESGVKITKIKVMGLEGRPIDAYSFDEVVNLKIIIDLLKAPRVEKTGPWKGFYFDPKTKMHYGAVGTFAENPKINLADVTLTKIIKNSGKSLSTMDIREPMGKLVPGYSFEEIINLQVVVDLLKALWVEKTGPWRGFYFDPKTKMHYGAVGTLVIKNNVTLRILTKIIKNLGKTLNTMEIRDLSGKPQTGYAYEDVIKYIGIK